MVIFVSFFYRNYRSLIMELGDVYSQMVPKKIAPSLSFGMHAPEYERDSKLTSLEYSVFSKLNELTKEIAPPQKVNVSTKTELKQYSVGDAIRELKELGQI